MEMTGGSEDQTKNYLNPGYGGQYFDAEYLLYNFDSATNVLSLALQTGFNIITNNQMYNSKKYWGGDIALSFDGIVDGDESSWEYAIDFGKETKGYNGEQVGNDNPDAAGLYRVTNWTPDNYLYFEDSNPFAMHDGDSADQKLTEAQLNQTSGSADNPDGYNGNNTSYYRIFSFDLDEIDGLDVENISRLDAHWTMTCGNDQIHGYAKVPEPHAAWLISSGMIGLIGAGFVRRRKT